MNQLQDEHTAGWTYIDGWTYCRMNPLQDEPTSRWTYNCRMNILMDEPKLYETRAGDTLAVLKTEHRSVYDEQNKIWKAYQFTSANCCIGKWTACIIWIYSLTDWQLIEIERFYSFSDFIFLKWDPVARLNKFLCDFKMFLNFFLYKLYVVKLFKNIFPKFQNSSFRTHCAVKPDAQLCCPPTPARPPPPYSFHLQGKIFERPNQLGRICTHSSIYIEVLNNIGTCIHISG